ncbi:hypothetical protein [Jannaschia sp. LMIT008]|uniref:hypothetical protein n=1 Tax=Jannaschia maritima TaxID=3032585 RepID=UPI002812475A|nr:hypothetical protein [Jannaschia sp. LMIT008]
MQALSAWIVPLLKLAGALFAVLVVLGIVGERTLPLFGGDEALAARTYMIVFPLLGGAAFAAFQPWAWTRFAAALRHAIGRGGAQGRIPEWVASPAFRDFGVMVGFGAAAFAAMGTIAMALFAWNEGAV